MVLQGLSGGQCLVLALNKLRLPLSGQGGLPDIHLDITLPIILLPCPQVACVAVMADLPISSLSQSSCLLVCCTGDANFVLCAWNGSGICELFLLVSVVFRGIGSLAIG